jgi:hypothetical protein
MANSRNKLCKLLALGVALTTATTTAPAAAQEFTLTSGDDTVTLSPLDVSAGLLLDAGEGLDILTLTGVSLTEVIEQGTVLTDWERVIASFDSLVVQDTLSLGAFSFSYSYSGFIDLGAYYHRIDVLDAKQRVVAAIKIDVENLGTEEERISLRIKEGRRRGTLTVVGGEVVEDSLSDRDRDLYHWATTDPGSVDPVPAGDQDPEAIVACFILGPAALACAVGAFVAISLFCCENPNGPGA